MSPYKDPQKRREAVTRFREKQKGITEKGLQEAGISPKNVTPKTMPSGGRITPALLNALTDKEKRRKLEAICQSLDRRDLGSEVRFGIGGVTFNEIEELLLTTA